jgi:large subunit ribosomal protein LP2
MKHLAAYLLLVAGGNASPSAEDIKTLLGTVGAEVNDERLSQLMGELEGKDINELITLGKEKLQVTARAAAPAAGGAAPAAAAAGAAGKFYIVADESR